MIISRPIAYEPCGQKNHIGTHSFPPHRSITSDLRSSSPVFSDTDFMLWRELIQQKIGMQIDQQRKEFLKRRLLIRMMQLSIPSFSTYYHYVTNESRRHDEWQELIEVIVNSQSSFFRHLPSFEALMTFVFPELISRRGLLYPVSIWSAGASRGQEAYSLSMAFSHTFSDRKDLNYTVIGSDVSRNAVERAKIGEYSYLEVMDMPDYFKNTYMTSFNTLRSPFVKDIQKSEHALTDKYRIRFKVRDDIRSRVRFIHKNIIDRHCCRKADDPEGAQHESDLSLHDVIFCQNMLIYLSISDRVTVISSLLNRLNPDGYVFFAPGETVGIKVMSGASQMHFNETLSFKRNKEAVHVQIIQ